MRKGEHETRADLLVRRMRGELDPPILTTGVGLEENEEWLDPRFSP